MVYATALPITIKIIISVLTMVLVFPLSALGLWISGRIFKVKGITFVKALLPAAIMVLVGFVLSIPQWFAQGMAVLLTMSGLGFLVGVALYLTLPKLFFGLEWKKSMLIGLVWLAIMLIIGLIVGIVVGILSVVIGLSLGIMAAA